MGLEPQGLYRPENEHDACGVGFVANIKGRKSHTIVEQGLTVLRNLTHRGAVGWDPKLSDGAGILIQIPDRFYREEMAKQGVKLPPAGQYGVGMVFLPRAAAERITALISRAGLPIRPPQLARERWQELIALDKKSADGRVRFVLLDAIGRASLQSDVDQRLVDATIAAAAQ